MSRRTEVLDAAISVLGTSGPRALTHRAVDAAAGAPVGTTSNHFRSREALVAGVLERISTIEAAPLADVVDGAPSIDLDGLVALVAERLGFLLGDGRNLALARHALFLEGAVNPDLRAGLIAQSRFWWDLGAALLAGLGVPDSARRSRWLFAYLDGLIVDQLARPDPDFDAAAAVRAAFDGLAR